MGGRRIPPGPEGSNGSQFIRVPWQAWPLAFSFDAFPSFGRASLSGRKIRKGAIRTLSFKRPATAQSEWMLDLLTAIAASLKDSLTVGWAKQVRATSSALPPYSMWAQAAAIISEAPLATI